VTGPLEFGQAGVDRVLDILQGELKLAMGNCGALTVAGITRGRARSVIAGCTPASSSTRFDPHAAR